MSWLPKVALRHEFTGYQSEEKSGLQYAGARYYLPELGVFTSHDPERQFPSPYAYGPGDPINGTDPTGEDFGLGALLLVISIAAAVARFIYTGIKTGKWGAAGFGLAINLAAIGIAYAVAPVISSYAAQFVDGLSQAWQVAYGFASRGYTFYRIAKAASSGDYISALEMGLGVVAMAHAEWTAIQATASGSRRVAQPWGPGPLSHPDVRLELEAYTEYFKNLLLAHIPEVSARKGKFVGVSARVHRAATFTVDLDAGSRETTVSAARGREVRERAGFELSGELATYPIGYKYFREYDPTSGEGPPPFQHALVFLGYTLIGSPAIWQNDKRRSKIGIKVGLGVGVGAEVNLEETWDALTGKRR